MELETKKKRDRLTLTKQQQIELLSNPCKVCGKCHTNINILRKCQGW